MKNKIRETTEQLKNGIMSFEKLLSTTKFK